MFSNPQYYAQRYNKGIVKHVDCRARGSEVSFQIQPAGGGKVDILMNELSRSLLRLDKKHRYALQWFYDHRGQTVPWSDLNDPDFRLSSSAKGIYKPKFLEYALSVKQTLHSTYGDRLPRSNDFGGWTYHYHEESNANGEASALHTNRGLEQCMRDGIPVGVLIQASGKPGPVTYKVFGLAMVRSWSDGFFTLEGKMAELGTIVSIGDYAESKARKAAETQAEYGKPK